MTYGTFLFLTFQICTQIVANSEYYLWIFCNISHFLCACVVDYYLHSCYTFNKDCYFPIPLLLPVKELLIDFSLHDYLSCTFLRFSPSFSAKISKYSLFFFSSLTKDGCHFYQKALTEGLSPCDFVWLWLPLLATSSICVIGYNSIS